MSQLFTNSLDLLLDNFVVHSGGQNQLKKRSQHGTGFGTRSRRLSGVWESPTRRVNEKGEKVSNAGNIFSKSKGGIRLKSGFFLASTKRD